MQRGRAPAAGHRLRPLVLPTCTALRAPAARRARPAAPETQRRAGAAPQTQTPPPRRRASGRLRAEAKRGGQQRGGPWWGRRAWAAAGCAAAASGWESEGKQGGGQGAQCAPGPMCSMGWPAAMPASPSSSSTLPLVVALPELVLALLGAGRLGAAGPGSCTAGTAGFSLYAQCAALPAGRQERRARVRVSAHIWCRRQHPPPSHGRILPPSRGRHHARTHASTHMHAYVYTRMTHTHTHTHTRAARGTAHHTLRPSACYWCASGPPWARPPAQSPPCAGSGSQKAAARGARGRRRARGSEHAEGAERRAKQLAGGPLPRFSPPCLSWCSLPPLVDTSQGPSKRQPKGAPRQRRQQAGQQAGAAGRSPP